MDKFNLDFKEIEPRSKFNEKGEVEINLLVYGDIDNIELLNDLYKEDMSNIRRDILFEVNDKKIEELSEIAVELSIEYETRRIQLENIEPRNANVGVSKLDENLFPSIVNNKSRNEIENEVLEEILESAKKFIDI